MEDFEKKIKNVREDTRERTKEIIDLENQRAKLDPFLYDKWVKEGMDLFGGDKREVMSSFLYGIQNFAVMRNSEFRTLILNRFQKFGEKNIKRIIPYDITNLNEIISEIKNNIIVNSPLSICFLVNFLSERICDGIISLHGEGILDDEKNEIAKKLKNKYYMRDKISYVKKILSKKGTKEGNQLIKYLELLKIVRNKFVFHFVDNDEYFFVYPDDRKGEKEGNLKSVFQEILNKILPLLEDLNKDKREMDEANILKVMNQNLGGVIKYLDGYAYKKEVSHDMGLLYRDFSENFVYIAYAFLLFLGRENLKIV